MADIATFMHALAVLEHRVAVLELERAELAAMLTTLGAALGGAGDRLARPTSAPVAGDGFRPD